MKDSEVTKIEVYNLYPGCPPEHLGEFSRTITAPAEIREAMGILAVAQQEQIRGEGTGIQEMDGGRAVEYRLHYSDGDTEQRIVNGAQANGSHER